MLKYDINPQKYPVIYDNKFGITDLSQLLCREAEYTNIQNNELLEHPNMIKGVFDLTHLCSIHRFLFQDIYPWAGELRAGNISKENSLFCLVQNIHSEFANVNKIIKSFDVAKKSKTDFSTHLAEVSDYINAIHPFREGNGRSKRTFLQLYADHLGYCLDYSQVAADKLCSMEKDAFITGDSKHLANLLLDCLISKAMLNMIDNAPAQVQKPTAERSNEIVMD